MRSVYRLAGIAVLVFVGVALSPGQHVQSQATYEIDSARSTIQVDVYKEGFFKAFGHDHLVTAKEFSGRFVFDPNHAENSSVTFRVTTKSLIALDPGESEKDRSSVQTTMQGKEVLDVEQFPEVTFSSTDVSKLEKKGDKWNVTLAGKLKLHGVEKPIHLPVSVSIAGSELIAQGEVFLLQTDYGITPVKVAGGTVKVKDRLRIHFEMHARIEK